MTPVDISISPQIQEDRKRLAEQVVDDLFKDKTLFQTDNLDYNGPPHSLLQDVSQLDTPGMQSHGINTLILTTAAKQQHFTDKRWATMDQIKSMQQEGVPFEKQPRIKKGAKGIPIEFWKFREPVKKENPKTGTLDTITVSDNKTEQQQILYRKLDTPQVSRCVVFNAEQIENIPPPIERKPTVLLRKEQQAVKLQWRKMKAELLPENEYMKNLNENEVTNRRANAKLYIEMTSMLLSQQYGIPQKDLSLQQPIYQDERKILAKKIEGDPNVLFQTAIEAGKTLRKMQASLKSLEKEAAQEMANQKAGPRSPEQQFLDSLSISVSIYPKETENGKEKQAAVTSKEVVLGGGAYSFSRHSPGFELASQLPLETCSKELGGHIYQIGKEYKGQDLNQLVNDLVKDDTTAGLLLTDRETAYLTISWRDPETKEEKRYDECMHIGDGALFDADGGKNGCQMLIDRLQHSKEFTSMAAKLDMDKVNKEIQNFTRPSFSNNPAVYHTLQKTNMVMEESFLEKSSVFSQARNNFDSFYKYRKQRLEEQKLERQKKYNDFKAQIYKRLDAIDIHIQPKKIEPQKEEVRPTFSLDQGSTYQEWAQKTFQDIKEQHLTPSEIVKKSGYQQMQDHPVRYQAARMIYYVNAVQHQMDREEQYKVSMKYVDTCFRAANALRENKQAFLQRDQENIKEAVEVLKELPERADRQHYAADDYRAKIDQFIRSYATKERNLQQLRQNTWANPMEREKTQKLVYQTAKEDVLEKVSEPKRAAYRPHQPPMQHNTEHNHSPNKSNGIGR